MANKKPANKKGKRYSADEKQEIVNFVKAHNDQNRRGGASAAAKKFGVSQLTIGAWLKAGSVENGSSKTRQPRVSVGNRTAALTELLKLEATISTKRKELEVLEARFQKLKSAI